jgi:hypothetical protein
VIDEPPVQKVDERKVDIPMIDMSAASPDGSLNSLLALNGVPITSTDNGKIVILLPSLTTRRQ